MGQNSDIHNIFESYVKKVLVKEQTLLNADEIPGAKTRLTQMQNDPKSDPEAIAKAIDVIKKSEEANKSSSGNTTPGISLASGNDGQMKLFGSGTQTSTAASQSPTNVPLSLNPQGNQSNQQPPTEDAGQAFAKEFANFKDYPQTPSTQSALDAAPKLDTVQAAKDVVNSKSAPSTQTQSTQSAPSPQTPTTDYDKIAKQYGLNASNNFEGNVNLQGANPYDSNKTDFSSINNAGGTNPIGGNPLKLNPDANIQPSQSVQTKSNKGGKTSGTASIVDYLASKNQASDKASRAKLAAQYGIQNYTGTAEQNTDLLNKLKANEQMPKGTNATGEKQYASGTVPKATAVAKQPQQAQKQQPQQGMGGIIGGASKLAGGAGNVVKNALIGNRPLGGIIGGASKLAGGAGNVVKNALIGKNTNDQSDEENIQENKNIAKFLKCLSEKNYAHANVYLKNIVNAKVKNNLSKVINKI